MGHIDRISDANVQDAHTSPKGRRARVSVVRSAAEIEDEAAACARHAAVSNGFGDAAGVTQTSVLGCLQS